MHVCCVAKDEQYYCLNQTHGEQIFGDIYTHEFSCVVVLLPVVVVNAHVITVAVMTNCVYCSPNDFEMPIEYMNIV